MQQIYFWRTAMEDRKLGVSKAGVTTVGGVVLAGIIVVTASLATGRQSSAITVYGERQTVTTQNKFYCNVKALAPAERIQHMELTAKLLQVRREFLETEKGYEFQFRPEDISLAELAHWAVAEGKCCPFFDFHIDLEKEGKLLCLRLTGESGIKAFIRAEFPNAETK
jgi:hypothetical protein